MFFLLTDERLDSHFLCKTLLSHTEQYSLLHCTYSLTQTLGMSLKRSERAKHNTWQVNKCNVIKQLGYLEDNNTGTQN